MTPSIRTLTGAAIALLLACQAPAFGHGDAPASADDIQRQIAEVRRATMPFQDVNAATAAGYAKFPDLQGDCVSQPGQGAMGIHYLNGALVSTVLDPLKPAALMYSATKDGRMRLLGVEYVVPQADWDALHPQPPVMFGHAFHLVRTPNRYGTPFAFYALHLWVWEHNRNGIFNDWNPAVSCP
jgi:hypothetical protein